MPARPAPHPAIKLAIDFGPVVVFFATYQLTDIRTATFAIAGAAALALVASRVFLGRVSLALLVSSGLAIAFGALTIALDDERYLKIRPTVVNLLFAATLGLGLALRRPFLKAVFGEGFPPMSDAGWHKLSRNFALFFVLCAGLNEAVWRNFSTGVWASYSSWGDMVITFAFMATQLPLIERHALAPPAEPVTPPPQA